MISHSEMAQLDLLEEVVKILTSLDSPERRIERALALLGHEPKKSMTSLKGSKGNKAMPVLIGTSPIMETLQAAIQRIASTPATVLIRGESGTGKELVARSIHVSSRRAGYPFVAVHCAAVPESLIESALFGHERGAFTGAHQRKKGRLEQASGGTLFLDEIGDIPMATQVKLLRVLQEKEYERVGGSETLPADVRVIAATHRNLEAMIQTGEFREDLYYRLNVIPLVLPPLRDRREDVPALINHFLDKFNQENRRMLQLAPSFVDLLSAYHWPGNIRELQNCIERLVALSDSKTIDIDSIPESLASYFEHMRATRMTASAAPQTSSVQQTLPDRLDAIERDRLREALTKAGWVKAKAARLLGMTTRQISYRMQKYQLVEEA
ncbi:sigma-54 interaction domain-containing protein [Candidatus Nitronereus thalassa]|uniref:Sigma 54-interacting transcriptional regulator n=1 Tax=Candidatus Nitronereus thalassa TaxID=3020898 RepID=A0ABU3KA04_9BACT|nr:sigma 54-interacting transcriptional regulator [Candidatus Nitronereus thalassa]MDT7043164.1 sigma 54-interacting transcriptional regulator [Candidatus Nitronereus thalassa]